MQETPFPPDEAQGLVVPTWPDERWRLAQHGAGDSIWELHPGTGALHVAPSPLDARAQAEDPPATLDAWHARIHPEDRAAARAALEDHLAGRSRAYRAEYRVRSDDGGWRWVLDRGRAVPGADGRPARVHGCHTDVTERKRLESDLALARDVALETARLKSQFLANMSHEIRTPMTGVIGMVELLLQSELDDEQRGFAETVRACGQGLLTVLNDILDWSKIEAGKLVLESVEFEPARLIEEVVELAATAAHGKGIRIGASFLPGLPARALGDPHRLRQVISNLVGNAVKFTGDGGVLVRAERMPDAEGRAVLRVEVVDSGIGIPFEAQERLFRSFSQADGSTTRRYGGTGLGLAISRQLVELMGGRIGVLSQPGQGATFWFYVVLGAAPAAPGDEALPPPLAGRRYLCITPHATEAQSIGAQLAALGAECVRESELAAGARRVLGESVRPFDAILVDRDLVAGESHRVPALLPAVAPAVLLAPLTGQLPPAELLAAGWYSQVALPARRARLEAALSGQTLGLAGAGAPLPRRVEPAGNTATRRVLLAEDNVVNQKVATRMLERLGCTVDVAGDGRAALEAWRRGAHDLILMDLQMPVMDGIASTAAIRALEQGGSHVPILALTASAAPEDRVRCLDAGMDDCLTKPIQAATLDAAIARWAPR